MSKSRMMIGPLAASAILVLVGVSVLACVDVIRGETITGSGRLATQTYDFAGFENVDISQAFDVEVKNSDEYLVSVTVDDNIVENLDVRLDGDTLHIGMTGTDSYRNVTLEAAVAMPALSHLKLSGASSADVASFGSAEPLKIELEGASRVDCSDMAVGTSTFDLEGASQADCRDVETGEVVVALQGASRLALSGSGGNLDAKAQGASQIDLRDFAVTNAKVKLEGASRATVNTGGVLDVDLAGSSDLIYVGAPTLGDIDMSGDSELDKGD